MISKEQSVPELEPTIYFHYHKQKTMACCLISYSLSKSTDSEGWDEISPEICFDVFSLENCSPGQNAERCQFWGAEGREERAEERKGENPWEHRGQLLDGLGVCEMFVAVSERRLECDCGPWWSHTRGDTKSSSWADCRAVPLIYTLEDLLQGTLQVCYCAAGQPPLRGLQCVLWELMEPNQMWTAALVLVLPSQKQALSLPALSHKLCFEGNAAGSNEQQCLSLYFVVLALGSHVRDIFVIHA